MLAKFQYHTNAPLGVCDRHTEMVSSSTKNGGLADSETLNIPYSPCFPYSPDVLSSIHLFSSATVMAASVPDVLRGFGLAVWGSFQTFFSCSGSM